MPFYRAVGDLPSRRHIEHLDDDGSPLFEEFIGEEGFSGSGSLLYHRGVPSALVDSRPWDRGNQRTRPNHPLRPVHLRLHELFDDVGAGVDAVRGRRLLLANPDVRISYAVAAEPSPLYCSGVGDEVVYIESGRAILESVFGTLEVGQGDNVVIPRMTIHRWIPITDDGPLRAYCVQASGHVAPPSRYLTRFGQFLEGSPLTERIIRGPIGPHLAGTDEASNDTEVYVTHRGSDGVLGSIVVYDHHPFDVVAWDGCLYPYAFNYRDFSPVTGETLQPPPTYQILQGDAFVICNFVPRKLEYHPKALTVPYYHSNVDSDEVMFYYAGETAARKGTGIGNGSVTLHPAGYTHGPTRQAYIESIGKDESKEMAFMIDPFRPLEIAEDAAAVEDPGYPWTWSGRGPDLQGGVSGR